MSRIGKQPIEIPKEVKVQYQAPVINIRGPKGEMTHTVPEGITLDIQESVITVGRSSEDRIRRSLHGLTRTLLANIVQGVSSGFIKELEIQGVGYKAEKSGNTLNLSLGFSHTIGFDEPQGIQISVDKQTIKVEGIDKCLVGQTAAKIRNFKKPDVYKGKGIRYVGETVRKKVGKTGAK